MAKSCSVVVTKLTEIYQNWKKENTTLNCLNKKISLKKFKFKMNSYLVMTSLPLVLTKILENERNSRFKKNQK